ncbi:hypothetical protein [Hamadaea tsunoensis]|uniref:hypothetical protein n=1 Tax=Hamadaea tsunoensis TaxID=53368 RepID=UPI000480F0A3|nr:hypothetical protein [Hamadaea tsunoensis]
MSGIVQDQYKLTEPATPKVIIREPIEAQVRRVPEKPAVERPVPERRVVPGKSLTQLLRG